MSEQQLHLRDKQLRTRVSATTFLEFQRLFQEARIYRSGVRNQEDFLLLLLGLWRNYRGQLLRPAETVTPRPEPP